MRPFGRGHPVLITKRTLEVPQELLMETAKRFTILVAMRLREIPVPIPNTMVKT